MNPTILIILLGCNVLELLMDRVERTIDFIGQPELKDASIHMFLSGGKKNSDAIETEASTMKRRLDEHLPGKISYILDEKSRNTAENFVHASQYLNTTTVPYDKIYIVTSRFHHPRAKKMLELVDDSREFDWILGDAELPDSIYWERVHMRNVFEDVKNAWDIL
jgi:uncharacterized SAM-binding protein YcdF (DUF218 family)